MNYSIKEMRREIAREIAMRKNVYRRALQSGRQRPDQLNRLIEIMQAIDKVLDSVELHDDEPGVEPIIGDNGVTVPDYDIEAGG